MTAIELKLALIFALFFVVFMLRWAFGTRTQRFRRHRFWPREQSQLAELPHRGEDPASR